MKIALLGNGRTGSFVEKLHNNTMVFNKSHPLELKAFDQCDLFISFLPGEAFVQHLPLLLESQLNGVIGSTGFQWQNNINEILIEKNKTWVWGHNFSLGMSVIKNLLEMIGKANKLFHSPQYSIHEIHHQNKRDAPSGTALRWENWLNQPAKITSERAGDVIGLHRLEIEDPLEKITLIHEAKDRALFAQGALWAANYLGIQKHLKPGLIEFSQLVKDEIKDKGLQEI